MFESIIALFKNFFARPLFKTAAFKTGLVLASSFIVILIIANISSITGFFTSPTQQNATQNVTVLGGLELTNPSALGKFGSNRIFLRQGVMLSVNVRTLKNSTVGKVSANIIYAKDNRTVNFDLSGQPEGGSWGLEVRGVEPTGSYRVVFEGVDKNGNKSKSVETTFSVIPWPGLPGITGGIPGLPIGY